MTRPAWRQTAVPNTTKSFSFKCSAVVGKLPRGAAGTFLSEALFHTDTGSQSHFYILTTFQVLVHSHTRKESESVESEDCDQIQVTSSLVFCSRKLSLKWEICFCPWQVVPHRLQCNLGFKSIGSKLPVIRAFVVLTEGDWQIRLEQIQLDFH